MGFFKQEYGSGLPFPSPGDLPDPGMEPKSPAWQEILYHLSHQGSIVMVVSTKKDAQCESWELSFIWGKMKTTTSDNCEELLQRSHGGRSRYKIWWRQSSMQSSTYFTRGFLLVTRSWCHHEGIQCFSRYEEMQRLGSRNQFLKISNHLKTCSTSFPGARNVSFLYPELLLGHVKGQQQQ